MAKTTAEILSDSFESLRSKRDQRFGPLREATGFSMRRTAVAIAIVSISITITRLSMFIVTISVATIVSLIVMLLAYHVAVVYYVLVHSLNKEITKKEDTRI